jgi:hypothetical protein
LDFCEIKKCCLNPFEKEFKQRFIINRSAFKSNYKRHSRFFFIENKGTHIHTFDKGNYLIESFLAVLEQELAAK